MATAAAANTLPEAPRTTKAHTVDEDARLGPMRRFASPIAELKIQVRNWQRIAFGALAVAAIAVVGYMLKSSQPTMIPYVVSIDKSSGQYIDAGVPPRQDDDNAIVQSMVQYTVKQFVTSFRTVTPDQDHQNKLVDENVKPFIQSDTQAGAMMTDFYKANNPYDLGSKEIVVVDADIPTPISGSTYQIGWTETTESLEGKVLKTVSYSGTATTEFRPVPPGPMQRFNPLGLYIKEIHWNLKDGSTENTTR